jgi:hypothetical protein
MTAALAGKAVSIFGSECRKVRRVRTTVTCSKNDREQRQTTWVDIQKEFFKGKKKLQSTLFDMEQISLSLCGTGGYPMPVSWRFSEKTSLKRWRSA